MKERKKERKIKKINISFVNNQLDAHKKKKELQVSLVIYKDRNKMHGQQTVKFKNGLKG